MKQATGHESTVPKGDETRDGRAGEDTVNSHGTADKRRVSWWDKGVVHGSEKPG